MSLIPSRFLKRCKSKKALISGNNGAAAKLETESHFCGPLMMITVTASCMDSIVMVVKMALAGRSGNISSSLRNNSNRSSSVPDRGIPRSERLRSELAVSG